MSVQDDTGYATGKNVLLGPRDIEKLAQDRAKSHILGENTRFSRILMQEFKASYLQIREVYRTVSRETGEGAVPPEVEWLLDNFYMIEEQYQDVRMNLARKQYSRLPSLQNSGVHDCPRIYALAQDLVNHTDGSIDETKIVNFIRAYQAQHPLLMIELWALAVMLKTALIERMSLICQEVRVSQQQRQAAEQLADKMVDGLARGKDAASLVDQVWDYPAHRPEFFGHLIQILRKRGAQTAALVSGMDQKLGTQSLSVEGLVQQVHQSQAARQVSIGNAVTSLRMVAVLNWNEVFESLSRVEEILRQDPSGCYNQMDFESRDHYRHVIEKAAYYYKVSEIDLTLEAVGCCRKIPADPGGDPRRHVGYFLIGDGRKDLEEHLGFKPAGYKIVLTFLRRHPRFVYFTSVTLATLAGLIPFLWYGGSRGASALGLVLVGLAILIPVSDMAIHLVHFVISHLYSPTVLPKLDLKSGIPPEAGTMVIIPTLLPSIGRVRDLLGQLEVYFLANKENNLYFALVGDFKDGPEKETPNDPAIVEAALKGVRELNRRYAVNRPVFFYFHRQRRFNAVQGQWMGWERKRGAIIEFNDLLRGSESTSFHVTSCTPDQIPYVQYVITLDADTSLPMGTARKLIGTMAHPLNRPKIDAEKGLVVKGHGLLQPRIGVGIDSANRTLFSRIFAGQGGIDPYTSAVSDVYQDLFGEGIFTGKGIYDLDTFQTLLKEAVPENTVLSHDLLEGSYVRAGLVTDIELIDGYPARYNSFSMRQHRWVRGDWQLLPWLGSKVRDRNGQWRPNPLSVVSKWKITDNLRRSLLNPALLFLIAFGFLVLPGSSLVWLGLAALTVAFPTLLYLIDGVLSRNYRYREGGQGHTLMTGARAGFYQAVLQFAFIAFQAQLMLDAASRTLVRVFISRKNLLEWIPAADLETLLRNDLGSFVRKMLVSPLLGLVVLGLALMRPVPPIGVFAAALVCGLWIGAPWVAYQVSRDSVHKQETLASEELAELRRLTRKTWAYFEDLAIAKENFLPPDNYQADPPNGTAHRTSPTNIGLLLTAVLAARDMGYLTTAAMLERLDATLNTVEKMEKWEGHLFNWYNTLNLRVLRPRYISTVDSGNFIGYLMVLEEGLREILGRTQDERVLAEGLLDTARIYNEELDKENGTVDLTDLAEYLRPEGDTPRVWPEVVSAFRGKLEQEGVREKVGATPWGKKLLDLTRSIEREAQMPPVHLEDKTRELIGRIRRLIDNTRFTPLFDPKRQLFSIGYNVEEGMLTKSYYDLLASEARLASYIAVARGEVDPKHWFRLGRKLTRIEGRKGLVSWAGTMFEYFMPLLVMRNYENSLLDATYTMAVKAQQIYGRRRRVPWGVSESAFYAFDIDLNYQYKAFGMPELGLKRGLGQDMVVAPYASVLVLTTSPKEAVRNLRRLSREGLDGMYGLYEAIDYTPARTALHGNKAIVQNFMAHHQGMSLLALNNFFHQNIMQRRFHANPVIKSAELLLQERMPSKVSIVREQKEEQVLARRKTGGEPEVIRQYGLPDSVLPKVHLLSNGSYSVMVTDGGSGYSRCNDMAVARWNESLQAGSSGFLIYIQNINSNNLWSAAYEPCCSEPDEYQAVFSPDKAEFFRKDGNIETHTQIVVSPEDNAEIRTVTLTNNSRHYRVLETTSYLETVLTRPEADLAHPAFSNLFVTTEFVPRYDCLLAIRRPRTPGETPVYAVQTVAVEGEMVGGVQFETDRSKFIGRNRDLSCPLALDVDQPLSNSTGAVLDPVQSMRVRVKVPPEHSVKISYTVAVTDNRKAALTLADKYRDPAAIERAFELAWTRSRIEAGYLDIDRADLETFFNMVPSILFPGPARRRYESYIVNNRKGQTCLWPFGISGDVPIVLVHIVNREQMDLVKKLLKAHEFWRMKGLKADLAFLTEEESGYLQPLQEAVREAVFLSHARDMLNRSGGVFLLNGNMMDEEDKILLYAAARVILHGNAGPIAGQVTWQEEDEPVPSIPPAPCPWEERAAWEGQEKGVLIDPARLVFFNGLGGFSQDGAEYVIQLRDGQHTPAPWINVIANPGFGFNVSETGGGYTWAENSRENKLTPWSNDPVQDPLGEVFYLRDEKTGEYWTITPMPVREKEDYLIRHGQGYTVFSHISHGLEQELTQFAALTDPVKICLIRLHNRSGADRELGITFYMRPILGVSEKANAQYVVTETLDTRKVLCLRNHYNCDFPGRLAFIDTSEERRSFTGDGHEFLGRGGSLKFPAAMTRSGLSGTVGAGLAPCGAMQVKITLGAGAARELVFLLGQGRDTSEVLAISDKYRHVKKARAEMARVRDFWREKLEVIQVSTPNRAMDFMLNRWLQYQVISCRLWSRAAFYQSGGAFGFRDQLQDVLALTMTWPELTRQQILLHAGRQFAEGDVQHWWHPEAGKGIRTRYSDDYLWLPYVTADYIGSTGDMSILDETVSFLEDEALPVHEDERYNTPGISEEQETLYVHCVRALDRALQFGGHGLPLMGSGDWNDGMNTVGNRGRGESVWLGWFLAKILHGFAPICRVRRDAERADRYALAAEDLAEAIEKNGWDGSWYRRAYFDDGTPLGSAENTECRIDSIAQSWAVISGIGKPRRAEEAMQAVDNYLVDREAGVIKLLTPPFGNGPLEPGYIKAYVPGVRENGGQYTHAAVWTVMAFARMGNGDKAGELFNLINPINHAQTIMDAMRYKVEPYVMAGDVYAVFPNSGRGGWSWYTGAAGWMYRVGLENILGLQKIGSTLHFDPCIPRDWPEFKVRYRLGEKTVYEIHFQNPDRVCKGIRKVICDGRETAGGDLQLTEDGREHRVQVIMGEGSLSSHRRSSASKESAIVL